MIFNPIGIDTTTTDFSSVGESSTTTEVYIGVAVGVAAVLVLIVLFLVVVIKGRQRKINEPNRERYSSIFTQHF